MLQGARYKDTVALVLFYDLPPSRVVYPRRRYTLDSVLIASKAESGRSRS